MVTRRARKKRASGTAASGTTAAAGSTGTASTKQPGPRPEPGPMGSRTAVTGSTITTGDPHIVAVTGAFGALGRRIIRLLEQDPAVERIIALDVRSAVDLAARD